MEFRERLEELLTASNTTPYRLSKETGITQAAISKWRSSDVLPDGMNLIKIAKYFGVSIDYLVGITDDTQQSATIDALAASSDIPLNELSDEGKDEVADFAKYLLAKEKKRRG